MEGETKTITIQVDSNGNPLSHPVIYDLTTDTRRPATQADIDSLLCYKEAFFELARLVKKVAP